jgi:hypothetical protein
MEMVILILAAFAFLFLAISPFLMGWPFWRSDTRKLTSHLMRLGDKNIELEKPMWASWSRVDTLTWIGTRVYTVHYLDPSGRVHTAKAEFYLPWWLNKFYDPRLKNGFDLRDDRIARNGVPKS